jgi:transcriptional regulator, AraC family
LKIMENTAISTSELTWIDDGFALLRVRNDEVKAIDFEQDVDKRYLQFHFCLKGKVEMFFNEGAYRLNLKEQQSYMLYNPSKDLPINIKFTANSWWVCVLISIDKFHTLFSKDAAHVQFLTPESKGKKYYVDGSISPAMAVALYQLMNYNLGDAIKQLYFKAKSYELLSLYFNTENESAADACPFLADEQNMKRIKMAKDIILDRMTDPPSLAALSAEIGLSLKKLKEGFKEVYGDTVYGFMLDHKLNHARQLLDSGQYNVNEVGLKIGYSTASHFISAFKKNLAPLPKNI